jgi:hypothetical protein
VFSAGLLEFEPHEANRKSEKRRMRLDDDFNMVFNFLQFNYKSG